MRSDRARLRSRPLAFRYATLVAPGRFFESPSSIRIGFGCEPELLERGLARISLALDDLARGAGDEV